jgi:hypothetical protein
VMVDSGGGLMEVLEGIWRTFDGKTSEGLKGNFRRF